MKKKLIITLASTLAIVGGISAASGAVYSVTNAEEGEITTYLVLSAVGQYNGAAGENFSELFLENAVAFKAKAGSALPGKDSITAGASAEFDHWEAYEGTGFPTIYTTVPNEDGKILYAFYKNTYQDVPGPGPIVDEGVYYLNAGIWDKDGAWFAAWTWGTGSSGEWMKLESVGGGYYSFEPDTEKVQSVIFVRMDGSKTEMDWSNKWNQTADLTLGTDNCYTITDWGGETSVGSWGTYSA